MAAAAILNFYFDTLDAGTVTNHSLLVYWMLVFKFRLDRFYSFEDILIFDRTFRKVGLKCLFGPPKFTFLAGLDPKHSVLDKRPRGRRFESRWLRVVVRSNRGPVTLSTLGLGLLNRPFSQGR